MLISESIPQLIEMDAINIPSVLCFHVPAVPKKMMLKALWYVDHQKTHIRICKTKDKDNPFEYFILKKDHKTGCNKITERLVSMYLKALTNQDDARVKDVEHFEAICFSIHWVGASSPDWGVPECDLNPGKFNCPHCKGFKQYGICSHVLAINHILMEINLRRELMEIGKSTLKKKDKGGGNRQSVEPALTKVPEREPDSSDDELRELMEQGAQGK
jgi:hypothetical protein